MPQSVREAEFGKVEEKRFVEITKLVSMDGGLWQCPEYFSLKGKDLSSEM